MLRVENQSRKVTLVRQGRVADNMWTRFKGLMGARKLAQGDGMLITPCSSVHCMFMRIPIDVIYVSKDNKVVAIDQELKPWRIGSLHRGVRCVVELPAGTAARTKTNVGDQLKVSY
jgi:uncharacterized membrane protein (UPF0127 family)